MVKRLAYGSLIKIVQCWKRGPLADMKAILAGDAGWIVIKSLPF